MAKFKYEIVKNNLSWESKSPACLCDHDLCTELGKYKAPKSRLQLNEYYLFCLKHVTIYNKSWDFYKGLNVDQIELSIRKDAVWDRPSWPLKGNPNNIISQLKEFFNNDYSLFEKEKDFQNFLKNKMVEEKLNNEEYKSLKILELSLPISLEKIKKKYKKLVKIFHPDVNDNNKKAENHFKEINEAYRILLKKFLKKNI
jgi:hypothetical protein